MCCHIYICTHRFVDMSGCLCVVGVIVAAKTRHYYIVLRVNLHRTHTQTVHAFCGLSKVVSIVPCTVKPLVDFTVCCHGDRILFQGSS